MTFDDVRMRGFRTRAEPAEVLRLLTIRTGPLPAEQVPVTAAAGRVLAAAVVSPVNVPGFARAAMDGYAVRGADTFGADPASPLPLSVIGEAYPGRAFAGTVGPNQAVRVTTGAPLPAGADAVVMAEVADATSGGVRVREPVSPGRHVGRVGEDVTAGAAVLPAGRRLRPQDAGLLAAVGAATVNVVRRPRVAILVTGNELLPPGATPDGYRIVDSNSPMLAALVEADGGVPLPPRYVPDTFDATREALAESAAACDVVLVSGGTSVGAEDHAPRAVADLGELAVHGVAVRPASPLGVGFIGSTPVLLLPGNPVSCLCGYDLFAGGAVRQLGGRPMDLPHRTVTLPLAAKLVSAVGRLDYARVRVVGGAVQPIAVSGAAILRSTVVADGFVLVAADREGHAEGDPVTVYLYD